MPAPDLRDVEALARDAALDRLIDELRGRPDRVSHWLARALRVDLALITAHPELTFPSVWRHGHAVREPAAVSILRPLLDAWRDQHGLHANTIVVDGAQRTTVDRRTGRRTTEPLLAPPRAWQLDGRSGHYRIADPATAAPIVDLHTEHDDMYRSQVATDADRRTLVIGGWWDEYRGVVTSVDVATGTVRWRCDLPRPVSWVACSADARLVVASCDDDVVLLDGATGAPSLQGRATGRLGALDTDATSLVTVDDHAVRVWDLSALRADQPAVPRGCDQGVVDARWSPDGTRLLTGLALCDGRDGRPIRALNMDTGEGYLEGGPSPSDVALGNDLLAELRVFGGTSMWDPRTGHRLPDLPRRHDSWFGRHWFAPDAERYVEIAHAGNRPAVLRRTRDRNLLATLDPRVEDVTWSADSIRFTTHGERARGHRLDGDTLVDIEPFTPAPPPCPYVPSMRDGLLRLTPHAPSAPSYLLPEDTLLVPNPSGDRWASRFAHYALEGQGDSRDN